MPVLSVIVPSYHASAYLSRCLDSIIGQTLKDLEIIVVSDGSAVDFAICRRYAEKDERVKFLKGRETGVGGARNVGLDAASGTYIAFVDADDWIEPNTFEESLSYFSNPDIDMVLFDTVVSNDLGYNSRQGEEYYLSLKYNGVCRVEKDVVLRTNVSVWNKIFKSDIIKEHQIRFPENMQYEDFPFFYQYAVCSRYFYYLNSKFYHYFRHPSSAMVRTYNHDFSCIKDHICGCVFLYEKLKAARLLEKPETKALYFDVLRNYVRIALSYVRPEDKTEMLQYALCAPVFPADDEFQVLRKEIERLLKKPQKEKRIYLFGCLPLLRLVFFRNKYKVYLFNFIPFLRILKKDLDFTRGF